MTAWIWMLLGLGGLLVLAGAMYYGQFKSAHPPHSRGEDRHLDAATREIYNEVEHDRQKMHRT